MCHDTFFIDVLSPSFGCNVNTEFSLILGLEERFFCFSSCLHFFLVRNFLFLALESNFMWSRFCDLLFQSWCVFILLDFSVVVSEFWGSSFVHFRLSSLTMSFWFFLLSLWCLLPMHMHSWLYSV